MSPGIKVLSLVPYLLLINEAGIFSDFFWMKYFLVVMVQKSQCFSFGACKEI